MPCFHSKITSNFSNGNRSMAHIHHDIAPYMITLKPAVMYVNFGIVLDTSTDEIAVMRFYRSRTGDSIDTRIAMACVN